MVSISCGLPWLLGGIVPCGGRAGGEATAAAYGASSRGSAWPQLGRGGLRWLGYEWFACPAADAAGRRRLLHNRARGDVSDWIAWDPRSGSYVLAEAKGRLGGGVRYFLSETPAYVGAGKAQFGRVAVCDVNSHYRKIATTNWVAANLWYTDRRGGRPVCLLWAQTGKANRCSRRRYPGMPRRSADGA